MALKKQGEVKKESKKDANEVSMPVLPLASPGPPPRRQRTVQAKLKPHRPRIFAKSYSLRPKGKYKPGSAKSASLSIEASEVDKNDDGPLKSADADIGATKVDKDDAVDIIMEKQRRKIMFLWEYSTLGKFILFLL